MSNFELIQSASDRLAPVVRETPLLTSPFLDKIAERRVLIKAECLQHTGSFKFRGGWSAISALSPQKREKGVIAFSSGNHAQGVAYAAREYGCPATLVIPSDAPELKIANTRDLGATVVLYDRDGENREGIGKKLAEEQGLTLIRPYDDPQVIAGQGTAGLEIAKQAEKAGIKTADVLVCCGGGGLTSGIALALEKTAPGLRARPVEPEGFDDVTRSLASGDVETNTRHGGSLCDAIVTPSPGVLTFPVMQRLCGPGIVVTEDEALRAMALAWQRLKIVLEPGGAVALAAALFHGDSIDGPSVIAVTTGGNVDQLVFARAMATLATQ